MRFRWNTNRRNTEIYRALFLAAAAIYSYLIGRIVSAIAWFDWTMLNQCPFSLSRDCTLCHFSRKTSRTDNWHATVPDFTVHVFVCTLSYTAIWIFLYRSACRAVFVYVETDCYCTLLPLPLPARNVVVKKYSLICLNSCLFFRVGFVVGILMCTCVHIFDRRVSVDLIQSCVCFLRLFFG